MTAHNEASRIAKQQFGEPDRLKLLLEVNSAIISHLDLHELFRAISGCLRQVIDYDVAGLALYDPRNEQLRMHVLEGDVEGIAPLVEGEVLRFGAFYGSDSKHTLDLIKLVRKGWAPIPGPADAVISSASHDDAGLSSRRCNHCALGYLQRG